MSEQNQPVQKSMLDKSLQAMEVFSTDEYKYKYARLRIIAGLVLKVAALTNTIVGIIAAIGTIVM
jgi:hypothetical protein